MRNRFIWAAALLVLIAIIHPGKSDCAVAHSPGTGAAQSKKRITVPAELGS